MSSKNDHGNFKIYINYSNFINFTGMIWTSQGFLDGDMVSSDTGILILKFMLQSQLMLFVDCIMTNIQNIRLTKIVSSMPKSNISGKSIFDLPITISANQFILLSPIFLPKHTYFIANKKVQYSTG